MYGDNGNLIYSAIYDCEKDSCSMNDVEYCQYGDVFPMKITFANGRTLTFDYSSAYYFDPEGLNLSEE